MKKLKNLNLDHFRLIAALMVVAIHTYPLNSLNETLDYLTTRVLFRIAVPIFLMITGYFLLPKVKKDINPLKKFLIHISIIYLISTFIYLPLNIKYLMSIKFNIIMMLKDFFFSGTFYHLWYFPALILGTIVTHLIIKYIKPKYRMPICILLYAIGLLGDNYFWIISNIKPLYTFYNSIFSLTSYTRNFLFYVPIFLILGYNLNKNNKALPKKQNLLYIGISIFMLLYEGIIIKIYGIPHHTSMYVWLPFAVYYIFKYLLTHHNETTSKKIRELSTCIYILHPWVIAIVAHLVFKIPILSNSLVNYIVVALLTILISLAITKREKLKKLLKK